jgi:hypothetical protein
LISQFDGAVVRGCLLVPAIDEAPYPPIEHPPSITSLAARSQTVGVSIVYVSEGAGTIETGKAAFRIAAATPFFSFLACGIAITRRSP